MLTIVSERIAQGFLSGIGVGALFYLYPVMKHIFNDKYRRTFKISEFGEELMGKAYADWLRSRTEDDLQYWQYLPNYMQNGYLERSVGTTKN